MAEENRRESGECGYKESVKETMSVKLAAERSYRIHNEWLLDLMS